MEIRLLKYFLTVAKEQNITRAAKQLHITQPTLSRQLAELEEELGTKLLVRGSRKITLTEEGILLKRRCRLPLSAIWERMPGSWRNMDWAIRYRSREQPGTGEKTC